jgi:hypothetical protein
MAKDWKLDRMNTMDKISYHVDLVNPVKKKTDNATAPVTTSWRAEDPPAVESPRHLFFLFA